MPQGDTFPCAVERMREEIALEFSLLRREGKKSASKNSPVFGLELIFRFEKQALRRVEKLFDSAT
jgi:hypothetical protein